MTVTHKSIEEEMQTKKQATKDATWMGHFARTSFGVHIMPFAAGTFLITLLLFAYYISTWRSFANFQAAIDTCAQPFCDFVKFYYPMGEVVFHTKMPLNGFVYSPFIAVLMAIFPRLGLHTALALWGILLAISIIFYLFLFYQLVPPGLPIQLLFVGLALSSFPLLHTLTWGQVSLFTTTAVLGALFFYERGQRAAAAVLLAFGLGFKFFPVIFLVPFVFRRDIRFLLYMIAACATFLFVIPCIFLGVGNMLNFYSGLLDAYHNFDWVITNYNSQYFPHVFIRLAKVLGMNARTYLPLLHWIAYGIAAINMGLVYLVQRARLQHANLWSFHIIFLTIPFVLMTSWPVDLIYISFGQGLLAWHLLEERNTSARSLRQYVALVFLFASIFISNIFFFNLIADHIRYGYIGFIFWAILLLLVISYMELLPLTLRQIPAISKNSAAGG
jgi:hypothetical protein